MTHLADKDSHAWLLIIKIKIEIHVVAYFVERVYDILNLLSWYHEILQIPFQSHKKHAVLTINILVKIDNIAMIVCDKLGYLTDDTLFIRAVEQ